MRSGDTPMSIAELLTVVNFNIKALPDKLKCLRCKSVLKNACQVSCGCRFCRTCIDDVTATGGHFCPGDSPECGVTSLSTAVPDYRAGKAILKLICQCPYVGCSHECPLADMTDHFLVCPKKGVDCPFRELGCLQGKLVAEEMNDHLQRENRSHSEILIKMVAKINGDMEVLKRELVLKDEQGKHMENEIKSMKIENESIMREKELLSEQVRQLSEKLEREIVERHQSDKRDSAGIRAVTEGIATNRGALETKMQPVRDNIRSVNDQLDCLKRQMESLLTGVAQFDNWVIGEDFSKSTWWDSVDASKTSGIFCGVGSPHSYQLASWSSVSVDSLRIRFRVLAGPYDALLEWPFRVGVTVTVAHVDRREVCSSQTQQCRIQKPPANGFSSGEEFKFQHADLRGAGLDLERGVRVSCQIVLGAGH